MTAHDAAILNVAGIIAVRARSCLLPNHRFLLLQRQNDRDNFCRSTEKLELLIGLRGLPHFVFIGGERITSTV